MNREFNDQHIMENVRNDMARRRFDADGLVSRFGSEWKDAIRSGIAEKMPKGHVQKSDVIDGLEQSLAEVETGLVYAEGGDVIRLGTVISIIHTRTAMIMKEVQGDLLQWIKDSLESETRGLKALVASEGHLRFLAEYIRDLHSPVRQGSAAIFDQRIAEAQADAEAFRRHKLGVLAELRQAIRNNMLHALAAHQWTIDTLLARFREAEEQYCLARVEEYLLEQAKTLASGACTYLANQERALLEFSQKIGEIANKFYSSHENFLSPGEQVLFIRFFDKKHDWQDCYKLGADEQGTRQEVNSGAEYRRFLAQAVKAAAGPPTLWDLIQIFSRGGEREIREILQRHCEKRFWDDFEDHPRQADVLQHPEMHSNWANTVQRLVNSAAPLARRESDLGGGTVAVQKIAYLGVAKTDGDYAPFIAEVRKHLISKYKIDTTSVNVQPTGKPHEIYLYIVTYAFPLSALTVVTRDCHPAYTEFYQDLLENRITEMKYHIPLHLSSAWEGKFEDLVVYSGEDARQIKLAREALLFGSLLHVVQVAEQQNRVEYEYNSGPPQWRQRKLGAKREAIEQLKNNTELRASFLQAVAGRERLLTVDQLTAYYWVLQYLSASGDLADGTPEFAMADKKMTTIYGWLTTPGGPDCSELDNLKNIPPEARAEFARSKLDGKVEWVAGLPSLAGLDNWAQAAAR